VCGRFTQQHDTKTLALRFDVGDTVVEAEPRYNVAPSQAVAVVVTEASTRERILDAFSWGLVPAWAKDATIASKMINARAETLTEKPAFRTPLRQRRCLIPADGFYEWDKISVGDDPKAPKQPYHFRRRDGELFGFAGLWEQWRTPEGANLLTCTVITTAANDTVGRYHERMPVILRDRDAEALWLDDRVTDPDRLFPLLAAYPDDWMEAVAVSRRVNSPRVDEPELLARG
jgi:putative SOS response-associated peptidase YedK